MSMILKNTLIVNTARVLLTFIMLENKNEYGKYRKINL